MAVLCAQDGLNPASNLLSGGIGRKWLIRHEEKCRRVEVVLELSKKARIGTVEIGKWEGEPRISGLVIMTYWPA